MRQIAPVELSELEEQARAAIEGSRDEDGERILNSILRIEPENHFALKSLSHMARERHDFAHATDLCRRAIAAHPDDIWLEFDKAQILRDQSLFEDACAVYHDVLARRPHFRHAYRGLGQVARQRGRWAEALTFFRLALEQAPADEWDRFAVAETLHALGRLDEAAAAFRLLLADQPAFFHAERFLGMIALAKGDLEQAIPSFETVYRQNPDDLWNINDLARAHHCLAHIDEARRLYGAILERDECFTPALTALCHIAFDAAEIEQAEQLLDRAERSPSDDPHQQSDIACLLARSGRLEKALAIWRRLAAHPAHDSAFDARFVEAIRQRAFEARASGDFAAAAEAWRALLALQPEDKQAAEALETAPDQAPLRLCHDVASREAGQYETPETLCDAALAAGAEPCDILVEKALAARARADDQAAETLFTAALAQDPTHLAAALPLARLLIEQGRVEEARAVLGPMLALPSLDGGTLLQLADLLRRAGDDAGTETALRLVLDSDPENADVLTSLAASCRVRGQTKEAEALLIRARAAAPDHIDAIEGAATLALDSGDLAGGLAGYRAIVRLDPARLWPRVTVARLTALVEDEEQGVSLFRVLLDALGPQPDVCFAFADLLDQLGRLDEAEAIAERGLEAHPDHPAAWTRYARLRIRRGDFARVEDMLRAAPDGAEADLAAGLLALARFDHAAATERLRQALQRRAHDQDLLAVLTRLDLLAFDFAAVESDLKALQTLSGRRYSSSHVGNLYDEFRLNDDLAQGVAEALTQAPERRRQLLRAAILDWPDYTPAGLVLLLELRRQGLLAPPPAAASPIPAALTLYSGSSGAGARAARESCWRDAAPGRELRLFDRDRAWTEIRSSGRIDLIGAFRSAAEPAIRDDLFRLFHLHAHGGVFVDIDVRPQVGFKDLFESASELILLQDDFGAVGKGLIACTPGHRLIGRALGDAIAAVNRGDHDMAWLCSGPGLLSRTLATALSEQAPDGAGSAPYVVAPEQWGRAVALDCWTR